MTTWVVILVLVLGVIGGEFVDIERLKANNAKLNEEIMEVRATEAQAKVAAETSAQKTTGDLNVIANQRDSAIKANQLTGAALTNSVRQYEASRGGNALCKAANPKVITRYVVGNGSATTDQLLATIPSTCQAVINDALACKEALKTCN